MSPLREIVAESAVRKRVAEFASELAAHSRWPVLVVIAEGARRFAQALAGELERLGVHCEMREVRVRRTRGRELGNVEVGPFETDSLAGREVIILDDIADEGRTLEAVRARVRESRPASLRLAVLVNKSARRRVALELDWVGFEVKDGWVVGFGMDLDGRYRDLDYLAVAEP